MNRVVATVDWLIKFPKTKLFHKSSLVSNHCPLSLQLVGKQKAKGKGKIFRFEAMWLKEASCEEVVNSAWQEGVHMGTEIPLQQCLDNCRSKWEVWNKKVFGHVGNNIARPRRKLEWLEMQVGTPENILFEGNTD